MTVGSVLRFTAITAGVIVLLVGLLWMFQRELVYLPDSGSPPPVPGVEEVVLRTDDGLSLTAWFAAPTAHDRDQAVLVAPGNGGNRAGRVPLLTGLTSAGFTVLLLEYRGYGGNPGSPDETGLRHDAVAAYRHLVDTAGFDPERLFYLGESLGAGVVSGLAVDRPPAGMLLRSPFTDLAAAGQEAYPVLPVRLLLWDRFPVESDVVAAGVPLAVVLGTGDGIIPPELSRRVARAASDAGIPVAVTEIDGADHNDPALASGPELIDAMVRLADSVTR
ncbi:hypothetical protein LX16_0959 [Stackebrandtia albiflava]|uniref:Serine aminopeptidase S33 domain-containing protein n=1 Tax=Stackebrandtia albiflava TaxID=406432 RepID=A0A562VBK6_9ACTN|nr:alpha/beta hydrolase [Stackebrandtia albiflava]TWJ15259.1 hypothetical protein LX16_0959 [Stackebrandtia albiflava]